MNNLPFDNRGKRFRESFDYIRKVSKERPAFNNAYGSLSPRMDLIPKPTSGTLPLLITGGSQQEHSWIAQNGNGWMLYPRSVAAQTQLIRNWNSRVKAAERTAQPVMQSLYIDLIEDLDAAPQPIHLGFRSGIRHLLIHLKALEKAGMNHVALNLRFNQAKIEPTLKILADEILPHFNH